MSWKLGHGRGKTCSKECRHKFQKLALAGTKSTLWRGGFYFRGGYKFIRAKDHPFANAIGYVREHRVVMEKKLGRYLKPEEAVHHINENRSDNRIQNLKLMKNNSEHMKEHGVNRIRSCICGEKSISLGLCSVHYNRFYDHGILDWAPRKRFNKKI